MDEDALSIVHAADLSLQRERFTIAHELAHSLIETTGANRPRRGADLERLCDRFAVELLMPRREFGKTIASGVSITNVIAASGLYQTSLRSTALRYAEMTTCGFVYLDNGRITWSAGALDPRDPVVRHEISRSLPGEPHRFFARGRAWDGYWEIEARQLRLGRIILFTPAHGPQT